MIEAIRVGRMVGRGGEKSLKVDVEFRGEEKNWKEKEGEAESAKIYVHAQGHGYRDRADGGWNRRGNRLILRASYVVSNVSGGIRT